MVGPTTLLDDVAARFDELGIHQVAVVDGERRVIGMLSETDLLRARQSQRAVFVGSGSRDTDDAPLVFARDAMKRDSFARADGRLSHSAPLAARAANSCAAGRRWRAISGNGEQP